ncbi:phosphonate metabolism protein/1,5-bisphosphokinase (PRPP-forming) PhnN [Rhodobacteraceae bacterium D3-12]|nr:phosphonate metabolism protein/1,5-bisphosphokinase (PRPP-forming) PhnN [Rhodobacteraceae bacterium D3-12]
MSGAIFAIVGPSGAGKDTVMAAVKAARPDLHLVRRVITRPEAAGGEDFEGVSAEDFAARAAAGAFALSWSAHGLRYGIPVSEVAGVAEGRVVLFNGSRGMLQDAARVFSGLRVISLGASDEVLAARLRARGRESEQDIAARLERAKLPLPEGLPAGLSVTRIDNSGALDHAVKAVLTALRRERDAVG